MSKNFFIWGLSVGLIISSISGMEKDFQPVLPKDLDVSDQHYKLIDFLKEKYSLSEDIVHGLHKNNLNGLLAVVLCQWLNTENTYDKEATRLGLPFEIMFTIFQNVLAHYGTDLMYSSDTIIMSPEPLTICFDGDVLCDIAKNKYNITGPMFEQLSKSNLTAERIALFCQWYCQDIHIPFEILFEIFNYAFSNSIRHKIGYLDEESVNSLNNCGIRLPGIGKIMPRAEFWIVDLDEHYNKNCLDKKKLQVIDNRIERKLKQLLAHIFSEDYWNIAELSLPLKKLLENSSVYTKSYEHRSVNRAIMELLNLFVPTMMTSYSHTDKRYSIEQLVNFRKFKVVEHWYEYCSEGFFMRTNHFVEFFNNDNKKLTLRLPLSSYTEKGMCDVPRFHWLFNYKEELIILYDSETGRYPVIPIPGNTIERSDTKIPFVHSDRYITFDVLDIRRNIRDKYANLYRTIRNEKSPQGSIVQKGQGKAVVKEVNNEMPVIVNQQNNQHQVAQPGYTITKDGYRINCLIQ